MRRTAQAERVVLLNLLEVVYLGAVAAEEVGLRVACAILENSVGRRRLESTINEGGGGSGRWGRDSLVTIQPLGLRAVLVVFAQEHGKGADEVANHAVSQEDDVFETREDLADVVCGVEAQVAAARLIGGLEASPATIGHGVEKSGCICASGSERDV